MALAVALGGCEGETGAERAAPQLTLHELESPSTGEAGMPFLSASNDQVLLSWLERVSDSEWALKVSERSDVGDFSSIREVARSAQFFVNWADFPSVTAIGEGEWVAHWLQRGPQGGYDYGIRIASSTDRGESWAPAWTPHEDGTATEHGFVSLVPLGDAYELLWLDGRAFESAVEGEHEMQLRSRRGAVGGPTGPEKVLDARICDCCQTDIARTASGAIAVFRDRSDGEIRDIGTARYSESEGWVTGAVVHADGWEIGGCPVNGPAVSAIGDRVAAAWFTAANDTARVRVAFSEDGGGSFAPPVQVDGGDPLGRVDVAMVSQDEAWVSWMERSGNDAARIMIHRVGPEGLRGQPLVITRNEAARSSGFPRIVPLSSTSVLIAWTDSTEPTSQVRVALINLTTS